MCLLLLLHFNPNLEVSTDFSKILNTEFHYLFLQRFSSRCTRTDVRTDMAKPIGEFLEIFVANASKIVDRMGTRYYHAGVITKASVSLFSIVQSRNVTVTNFKTNYSILYLVGINGDNVIFPTK